MIGERVGNELYRFFKFFDGVVRLAAPRVFDGLVVVIARALSDIRIFFNGYLLFA